MSLKAFTLPGGASVVGTVVEGISMGVCFNDFGPI